MTPEQTYEMLLDKIAGDIRIIAADLGAMKFSSNYREFQEEKLTFINRLRALALYIDSEA